MEHELEMRPIQFLCGKAQPAPAPATTPASIKWLGKMRVCEAEAQSNPHGSPETAYDTASTLVASKEELIVPGAHCSQHVAALDMPRSQPSPSSCPEDEASIRRRQYCAWTDRHASINWDECNPLTLARADRRASIDYAYQRSEMSVEEVKAMKSKWRLKQVRKYSEAASVFGPRESQEDVFECITIWRAEQERKKHPEANSSSSTDSTSSPQKSEVSHGSVPSSLPGSFASSSDHGPNKKKVLRDVRKLASKFTKMLRGIPKDRA
jgi:hypothetical protein